MEDLPEKARGTAVANEQFIDLTTVSGYRLGMLDPAGKHYHFDPTVPDDELGSAVLDVLNSGRSLSLDESSELRARAQANYDEWVADLMSRHGYRSRRDMFLNMKSCRIERSGDEIALIPTNHEKLEAWSGKGITKADYVIVSRGSTPAEVGAALRMAFERCL